MKLRSGASELGKGGLGANFISEAWHRFFCAFGKRVSKVAEPASGKFRTYRSARGSGIQPQIHGKLIAALDENISLVYNWSLRWRKNNIMSSEPKSTSNREPIPDTLFKKGADELEEKMQGMDKDSADYRDTAKVVRILRQLSKVKPGGVS